MKREREKGGGREGLGGLGLAGRGGGGLHQGVVGVSEGFNLVDHITLVGLKSNLAAVRPGRLDSDVVGECAEGSMCGRR